MTHRFPPAAPRPPAAGASAPPPLRPSAPPPLRGPARGRARACARNAGGPEEEARRPRPPNQKRFLFSILFFQTDTMASLAAQPKGGSAAHSVVRDALQEMVINDAIADAADKRERDMDARQLAREQNARANKSIVEKYKNEEARGSDEEGSGSETDEEDRLLLDDDTALEEIRKRRMAELRRTWPRKRKSRRRVRHLPAYRRARLPERGEGRACCAVLGASSKRQVDQHMQPIAHAHRVQIHQIDAEKAPFFVGKLNARA